MGCGLSLGSVPRDPVDPADAATDARDGTIGSADTGPDALPPAELDVTHEEPVVAVATGAATVAVVAMGVDPMGKVVVLTHDTLPVPALATAYEIDSTSPLYDFPIASPPSSLAPIPGFDTGKPTVGLYALAANGGLNVIVDNGGSHLGTPFGSRPDANRVHVSAHRVFVGTSVVTPGLPSATRIVACPAAFPATNPSCEPATLVYDGQELGGFAVSQDGLLLVGLAGEGATLRIAAYSRPTLDASFSTVTPLPVRQSALVGAVEIVSASDDRARVRIHAPCRANEGSTQACLLTLRR